MTQELIEMAKQVGFYGHSENFFDCTRKQIEAFAKLVAAKEREACAKLCDSLVNDENTIEYANGAYRCSVRIRERGEV